MGSTAAVGAREHAVRGEKITGAAGRIPDDVQAACS